MKYQIVQKPDLVIDQVVNKIRNYLDAHGFEWSAQESELIICIGGDGTLLHAVHENVERLESIRFVAIHAGTLGFFTDYTIDEIDVFLNDLTTKQGALISAPLLEVNIVDQEGTHTFYALNEIRIENVINTQRVDVKIDGEYFETIHGSGVCLATQVGSTAYNRSLRGAVVDNGLELMQLCEITAIHHHKFHSLGVPYIMHKDRVVEFDSQDFTNALFLYDHKYRPLLSGCKLICTTSHRRVNFIRYRNYSYLNRLKNLY
ncbi:MAG: NAD(+)/NADH kinase [Erysipelotrichaceae bacterium]